MAKKEKLYSGSGLVLTTEYFFLVLHKRCFFLEAMFVWSLVTGSLLSKVHGLLS